MEMKDLSQFFVSDDFIKMIGKVNINHGSIQDVKRVTSTFVYLTCTYVEVLGQACNLDKNDLLIMLNYAARNYEKFAVSGGMAFKNNDNRTQVMNENDFAQLCIKQKLLDSLGVDSDNATPEKMEEAKEQLILLESIGRNKYHAFNGSATNSIMSSGLDQDKVLLRQEKDEIQKIFEEHGKNNIFNSGSTVGYNSRLSYSESANALYNYALTSPEWFSYLCGQENYIARDYESALKCVMDKCYINELTKEETQKVLGLFEKGWQSFAEQKLMLAVIPEKEPDVIMGNVVGRENGFDDALTLYNEHKYRSNDNYTEEKVDTQDAAYIELPSPQMIIERLEELKKEESQQQSTPTEVTATVGEQVNNKEEDDVMFP